MKVMHVFISMPVGGAEDLVLSFLRSNHSQLKSEAVCLRELGAAGAEAQGEGLPIHLLPVARRKQFSLPGVWRLSRWLKANRVEAVHSHVYNSHQYAVPAARLAGIPCILHHHKTFNPERRRRWFILRLLSRYAARHLTLSEQTRLDTIKALGIPDDRVECLPNCVDTTIFRPPEDKLRLKAKLGLPVDRPVIGGIASLAPQKNHQATIRMFHSLKQESFKFYGIICGEGPKRQELENLVAETELTDEVVLPGNKRPLAPWLQAMDLLVFPSTWEGQPLALLQAVASGIPAIASNIEGNAVTLGAEHPGLFDVDSPQDYVRQVRRFFDDSQFADRIRSYQRKRFDEAPKLGDYLNRLNAIYEEAAGPSR